MDCILFKKDWWSSYIGEQYSVLSTGVTNCLCASLHMFLCLEKVHSLGG